MKAKVSLLAALLAAVLALPSQARAPEQKGWLLLAQSDGRASCVLDGRKVPQGTRMCRDGYVTTCSRSGTWTRSGTRC